MSGDVLLCETDGRGVARVTLNRPELHNALDEHLIARLGETFAALDGDAGVRAVVLAGAGKSFCAGGDLNWMRRTADYDFEQNVADARGLARMLDAIDRCAKPVLALVRGNVYGGGNGLVGAADIAIATEGARFSLSEVRLGLIPATISPYVVRAMGARNARRYFLTAEVIEAAEAQRIGLVHEVVPEADLEEAGERVLAALLAGGPNAQAASKELIANVADRAVDDTLMDYTARGIATVRASAEGKEGAQAFLEKRKPTWRS